MESLAEHTKVLPFAHRHYCSGDGALYTARPVTGDSPTGMGRAAAVAGLVCLCGAPLEAEVTWSAPRSEISVRYVGYAESSPREDREHFLEGELATTLRAQLSKSWELSITPLLQYDLADRTADDELRLLEDGRQRPALTLREATLTWRADGWEVELGKQTFTWGVADGFKPTDVLAPYDFLEVPRPVKLGVPAASVFRYGEKLNAQLVVVPHFSPHRLPASDHRWSREPEGSDRYREVFGVEPVIGELARELPSTTLDDVQVGVRLSSSTLASGWDLAVSAFRGFDPYGVFRVGLAPPPVVDLTFVYPEYRQLGASFSTTRGPFELHGEVGYHDTVRNELEDDYLQYVAGVNYTIAPSRGLDQVVLVLEYAGDSAVRERPDTTTHTRTGFSRSFDSSVVANVLLLIDDATRVEVGGIARLDDGDFSTRVKLHRRLADGFALEAGVDVFDGPADSFFGFWQDNDRWFVHTSHYF